MNTAKAAIESPAEAVDSRLMDLDFITRHQIVERYLAGTLPARGARDFEQFCTRHPELLDNIGLANQVHAGLRLLAAGGTPEPWVAKPLPVYQRLAAVVSVAVIALVLAVAVAVMASRDSRDRLRIADLQRQLTDRPLAPATSTRSLVLAPNRTAPTHRPAAVLDGRHGEMADMKVDVSWSSFTNFRVLIDRIDQGRFETLTGLQRDSNGQLRLALNSTALGPGDYQMTIEGLDWRGTPEPQGWVTFSVAQ